MSHAQTNKQSLEDSFFLSNEILLVMLENRKKTLEEKGVLRPLLFIELSNGERFSTPAMMPGNSEKYRVFQALGKEIRLQKGTIKDVVLTCKTWIDNAQEGPDAIDPMPSQHACLDEAIVLMGRNADQTRSAIVIQKFTRDEHNAPVWSAPQITMVDSSAKGRIAPGFLDALFDD